MKDLQNILNLITGASLGVTLADVNYVVNIVLTVIIIVLTVFNAICNKYKDAKKDGVITGEEVKDIVDTAIDGGYQIKEELDKANKK